MKEQYVVNSPFTVAARTKSAGGIAHKVKRKFKVEVMFLTGHSVICKVVDGLRDKKAITVYDEIQLELADNEIIEK